jgi:putative zinc finger/helix-turn-helix YgiT family protein
MDANSKKKDENKMIEKLYCPSCNKITVGKITSKEETFNVKGEDIKIKSSIAICNECKEEVFVEELEEANLKNVYTEYRKRHDLLTSTQITEIRERYGLSQRSLSKLLGWGEVTIHRYESGSLQDEAHDEVLKLIAKPENLLEIYEKQSHFLAPYVSEALKKRIDDLIKKEIQPNFHKVLEQLFLSERKVGEFTGYKNFDLEKIKSMILYILGFHETYVTKINKLLWYMDFLCYKAYSVSISGNSYTHSTYGPTADDYELIIGVMLKDELIGKSEVIAHDTVREQLKPLTPCDRSIFSEDEIKVMDFVLAKFKDFKCSKISEYSHKEAPYKNTTEGQKISYTLAEDLSLSMK